MALQIAYKTPEGAIPTGSPQTGRVNDWSDEKYRYELMWTGNMHSVDEPNERKKLEALGLIFNGQTPTIRKVPIEINANDGSGARWYIDHKNFRTLGMMERELGVSSQAVMEAHGYGRPAKPLNVAYECPKCAWVCGNETALEMHMAHVHDHKSKPDEGPIGVAVNEAIVAGAVLPKCAAITGSGAQCKNDAVPGSQYCSLPPHKAKENAVPGVTTS